ncbi:hypothetical protein [Pistricoccus aurantiacus]|uniref:hypothetical protein n=1 Tax=Pistricoccus aurantiacus TaxID=1883414 RepID=UPI003CCC8BD6
MQPAVDTMLKIFMHALRRTSCLRKKDRLHVTIQNHSDHEHGCTAAHAASAASTSD